jgi:hypothetical protein
MHKRFSTSKRPSPRKRSTSFAAIAGWGGQIVFGFSFDAKSPERISSSGGGWKRSLGCSHQLASLGALLKY